MSRVRIDSARRRRLLTLAAPVVLVLAWQAAAELGLVRPILLPPPGQVAETLWGLLASGELPRHIGVSLLRVAQGFALAALVGLSLGIALGLSQTLDAVADLLVQLIKPVPPIAWIPISILWFGLGEAAKIYIIFIGGVFPILINTIDGIRQTDGRYVELAALLEVSRVRFIRRVILPGALPAIMTGLRIGLNVAWMCVVAAELINAQAGVGYLIMDARQLSQTDIVLAGMATLGLIGKLTDDALRLLERRLIGWRTPFGGR